MNIVIIEDEMDAYTRLSKLVKQIFESSAIVAHLSSVHSAKEWFSENRAPDLVFIDINLGDGTGFDVLNMVKMDCPFVFTTAYDEYAIEAFQTNGIAYLLKPITPGGLEDVKKKLSDYNTLFGKGIPAGNTEKTSPYKKRFIIKYGENIKTVGIDDIAYCYAQNKGTFIKTFDEQTYQIDYTLDVLEEILNPVHFFRINRQYIICIKAIDKMKIFSKSRIIVSLKPLVEDQVVSSERTNELKMWLNGEL
jgi:two-component system response regulator LytT